MDEGGRKLIENALEVLRCVREEVHSDVEYRVILQLDAAISLLEAAQHEVPGESVWKKYVKYAVDLLGDAVGLLPTVAKLLEALSEMQ